MFGIHVANKGWIPDSRRYPNKSPNETFQVPRYLFPQHAYLSKRVPKCVSKLIINFAYHIGPRARVNATIIHDYAVAILFYKSALCGQTMVDPRYTREPGTVFHIPFYWEFGYEDQPPMRDPDWFPLPYLHPLRANAITTFLDFADIPWVSNQVH